MIDELIVGILNEIDVAEVHLEELHQAIEAFNQAGRFDESPHFQWQTRNGNEDKKYLYLLFHQRPDGSYTGPEGKRKVYVGTDQAKIDKARRMAHNFTTWQRLREAEIELKAWIARERSELQYLQHLTEALHAAARKWPCYPIPTPEYAPVGAASHSAPALAGELTAPMEEIWNRNDRL